MPSLCAPIWHGRPPTVEPDFHSKTKKESLSGKGKVTLVYCYAPKELKFDSTNFPEMVGKTEGMALLGDGSLALINDDDFGITGARTQIVVLRGINLGRR